MRERKTAEVVPLFSSEPDDGVEEFLVLRPRAQRAEASAPTGAAIDLTGKPKLVMALGSGNVGKTMLLRWIAERVTSGGAETYFASIDPLSQGLGQYFASVHEPPSSEPDDAVRWLKRYIEHVITRKAFAAVDFAGGDLTLPRLLDTTADLVGMMRDAGVEPVVLYPLSPRPQDLSTLANLEAAGFQPPATAVILNEGLVKLGQSREQAFASILRHSAFRGVIERGGMQIWMPRLFDAAPAVESRRITFAEARDAAEIPGRKVTPLGPFDRAHIRLWLKQMEAAFAPIASWLQ